MRSLKTKRSAAKPKTKEAPKILSFRDWLKTQQEETVPRKDKPE